MVKDKLQLFIFLSTTLNKLTISFNSYRKVVYNILYFVKNKSKVKGIFKDI